jgi:hypothetical protein
MTGNGTPDLFQCDFLMFSKLETSLLESNFESYSGRTERTLENYSSSVQAETMKYVYKVSR